MGGEDVCIRSSSPMLYPKTTSTLDNPLFNRFVVVLFFILFCLFVCSAVPFQRYARLHGAGSLVEGDGLRFQRRLVQLRLHAVQTAQRPFAVSPAQNERQARDRPDDFDHGISSSPYILLAASHLLLLLPSSLFPLSLYIVMCTLYTGYIERG